MLDHRKVAKWAVTIDGIIRLVFTLPWMIAYFAMVWTTDKSQCTDLPWIFANIAQWFYLAMVVWVVASIPLNLKAILEIEKGKRSLLSKLMNWLGYLLAIAAIALWVFSFVAIAKREDCTDKLINLIWVNMLMPAFFLFVVLLCMCCMCVCGPCYLKRKELYNKGKTVHMEQLEKQKLVKTNHTEVEMGGGPKGPRLQSQKHANYLVAVNVETGNQPQIEEKKQTADQKQDRTPIKTPNDIEKNHPDSITKSL